MRLLIITYHFHPSNAIGAVRWTGLARALAESGWQVEVITASGDKGEDTPWEGVHVTRAPPDAPVGQEGGRWTELVPSGGVSLFRRARAAMLKPEEFPDPHGIPDDRGRIRREAAALSAAPDQERAWARKALAAAARVGTVRRPHLVLSSGPPHSAHLAGAAAAKALGVAWVADLRDPVLYVPDPLSWVGRLSASFIEQLVVSKAELVLSTSPTVTRDFSDRLGFERIFTVRNGVMSCELPSSPSFQHPGFSICHLGSVVGARDPSPVLLALARLLDRRGLPPDDPSALSLVGWITPDSRNHLSSLADRLRRPRALRFVDPLPRAEAQPLLLASDLALVLAQRQHHSIPGKLYESVAAGVPTLVLTEPGSSTWEVAEDLGVAVADPSDQSAIDEIVERAASGRLEPPDPATRAELDYSVRVREVARLLERAAAGGSTA